MFGLETAVADSKMELMRKGNRFIMRVLIELGYSKEMLHRLNQVRIKSAGFIFVGYTHSIEEQDKP